MAAISFVSSDHQTPKNRFHHHHHGPVIEEVEGLIRVFKDGCVERPYVVPTIPPATFDSTKVIASDIILPNETLTRVYVPRTFTEKSPSSLPLLVYFHGGGFCLGSAAWRCYHEFLTNLAVKAKCVILSANYRLAPENPLPAAYDDGLYVISWLKQQALDDNNNNNNNNYSKKWWFGKCNLSSLFLVGDSAGANIAYHVAIRLTRTTVGNGKFVNPLTLKGIILIQPFFGGESRTMSEKHHSSAAALPLSASDTYWRLALPCGTTRDHPWCNPLVVGSTMTGLEVPRMMVCVSEMDILKDRNLELVKALRNNVGNNIKKVEAIVYGGVGHAFQILYNSPMSHIRVQEMLFHIQNFIN